MTDGTQDREAEWSWGRGGRLYGLAYSSPERGVCGEMVGETGREGEERAEGRSR